MPVNKLQCQKIHDLISLIGISMTSIIMDMNTITLLNENGIEAHKGLINIWSLLIWQGTFLLSMLSIQFYVHKPIVQ